MIKVIKMIIAIIIAFAIIFGALLLLAFSKVLFTLISAVIAIVLIACMIYEIIK